ncbi:cytochrome P450 [Podospora didyma]|uniref:Cytochrome P450 n=1 Tax=Podospora didyma TaxID=330526 RepID=A0AAE0KJ87_9PEZI|nr:cytochrome P450 [Podospora didyma]
MVTTLFLRPTVLVPATLLVVYLAYRLFVKLKPSKLPNIPIIGAKKDDWFPVLQAAWRNTLDFKAALLLVDKEHKNEAVLLPFASNISNMVLLPRSDTQWVIDQPDSVLNLHTKVEDDLQIDYTVTDPHLIHNPTHHKLITTTLTNQVGNLVPDLIDEAEWAFGEHWGSPQEYTDVCVYETLRCAIGNVTNRVFLGKPMCRNKDLLALAMAFAQDIPVGSQLLLMVPKPLRPLAALLITIPNKLHTWRYLNLIRPLIKKRLAEYDARQRDPEDKSLSPPPNDFLQWSIDQARTSGDPYMYKPDTLGGRVLLVSFASLHTSSFALTHAVLDLASSKQEYISELREEIESVLAEHGGQWNKRALSKMEKLDSTLRESQRMNSFVTLGLGRRVMAKDGITAPSGVRLPYGMDISVPGYTVFKDNVLYPDADQFQPFRFSQQRRDLMERSESYLKSAGKAWATTSNEYIAFGHGRNACPGRFFASSELKLMLAHIVMNYDFEMQETRPKNLWFGINRVPPMKATIRVKKRVAASS